MEHSVKEITKQLNNDHIDLSEIEFDSKFNDTLKSLEQYDSKLTSINKLFSCGTSGFRYDEKELDKLSFRVALVTSIQSQYLGGLPVGIMVTASHNKYTDNGFKIAGLDGENISIFWEEMYAKIVNSQNLILDVKNLIVELINTNNAHSKYFFRDVNPIVLVACDTRRSSPNLVKIVCDCLKISGAKYKFYGNHTTPALHFLTLLNQISFKTLNYHQFYFVDGEEYWKYLKSSYLAFDTFYEKFYSHTLNRNEENKYENKFTIDCSNGMAAYHHDKIIKIFNQTVSIHPYNTNYQNASGLNEGCGAEFVHKEKKIPTDYGKDFDVKNVSFDGDVDRVVYL